MGTSCNVGRGRGLLCLPTVGGICSFCSLEYTRSTDTDIGSSDDHIRKLRRGLSPTIAGRGVSSTEFWRLCRGDNCWKDNELLAVGLLLLDFLILNLKVGENWKWGSRRFNFWSPSWSTSICTAGRLERVGEESFYLQPPLHPKLKSWVRRGFLRYASILSASHDRFSRETALSLSLSLALLV